MSTLCRLAIIVVATSASVWSQTTAPLQKAAAARDTAPATATPGSGSSSVVGDTVAPSSPVITVAGICSKDSGKSSGCSTEITREQFERLVKAAQPGLAADGRQRFAVLYSQLLVFANAAQQRGLDKTEDGQQALQFAQLQALSQVMSRKLQADLAKVSSDDVQKYYREHVKQFEEATLQRLYVPRGAQSEGKPIKEEDAQAEMKQLRERATLGESIVSLQKQAYANLGVGGEPPASELNRVRRKGLSTATSSVFDLQLGALSEVISEPNGLYVFVLTSKRMRSMQEATPEIVNTLQNERLEQALEQISGASKATFNADYFGAVAKTTSTPPTAAALAPEN